jgi:hypothetical protein
VDAWEKRVENRKDVWDMRTRAAKVKKQQEEDEKYSGASEN